MIAIQDPLDPRIEPYRAVRDRDLAGRGGRYVLEGEVVLRIALASPRIQLESILLHERVAARAGDLLASVPAEVPVYAAAGPVLDAIVGFPLHRGILGMGVRAPEPDLDALIAGLPEPALVVVLAGLANHDNVGGIFRNAAAFGVGAMLLDQACCDPLYRKSIRVSAGAALTVPFRRGDEAGTLCERLAQHGFTVLATSPAGRQALQEVRPGGRVAVLFGAEGPGLPGELLAALDSVRIDMAAGLDSLNVATSAGIVLHHLRAAGRQ